MDGSRSGFADDLFIKGELPDHTAESAKDIILNNASSLDETLAEDRYKQNLRTLEIVPSIRRYGEQRRLTSLVPFGKIVVQGQASRRPILLQWEQQNGNRVQTAGNGGELVGAARVLVRTFTMEPQTFDLLVPKRECFDHGRRHIRSIAQES